MSASLNRLGFSAFFFIAALASSVQAASHSWRVKEIFSDCTGTIQFIELWCVTGNDAETSMNGKSIKGTPPGTIFTIVGNLVGGTSNKHLLFATDAFAALPGAPPRNYAIPPNFISTLTTTMAYHFSQPSGIYHDCAIGAGVLPTDGVMSITNTVMTNNAALECNWVVGVNSPTNFLGTTGSVNVDCCMDVDGDGYGSPGDASCPNGAAQDCNDANLNIHPGATEIPDDGIDQDCSGTDAVTCFQDTDNDDYGSATTVVSPDLDCLDAGEAPVGGDCNDGDPAVNPNAVESCTDLIDNDCNGDTDCTDSACESEPTCPLIPTVSQWGVATLTLLMLAAGTLLFARRRRATVG